MKDAATNVRQTLVFRQVSIAVAEQAVVKGKAEGADTTRFEKFLANLKAGKDVGRRSFLLIAATRSVPGAIATG